MVRKRTVQRTAQEIDAEIAKLQQEREQALAAEKAGVVARMKEAIAFYGLTAADLGLDIAKPRKRDKAPKAQSPARRVKYQDEAGHTWSGYGPRPKWFTEALASGKTEADLLAPPATS